MMLNEYQAWTRTTAKYTGNTYPRLALAEEVGEFLGKLAKFERDWAHRKAQMDGYTEAYDKLISDLTKEGGDILWQLARALDDVGIKMQAVLDGNVHKITGRMARGTIGGSGDDR
jgi:NTP pyrophosphatase (non-canonical NTP hydrolase)